MGHAKSCAIMGLRLAGGVAGLAALAGCGSYVTPGGAADFSEIGIVSAHVEGMTEAHRAKQTDSQIRQLLERQPLADFPAHVAVAHVQDGAYRSYHSHSYGQGRISLVSAHDEKSVAALDELKHLPGLAGVAPLNRMVVPLRVDHERQLREAAAAVHADMLLLYTFDTQFATDEVVPYLGVISLGIFPDRVERVTSTASAALIDVRNGFVYGLAEASADTKKGASAWTSRDAAEDARRTAEAQAFEQLVDELRDLWTGVLREHAPELAPPPVDEAEDVESTTA